MIQVLGETQNCESEPYFPTPAEKTSAIHVSYKEELHRTW